MLGKLYIVTNDEGTFLVKTTPENAAEMAGRGWRVLWVGVASWETKPGKLATISEIDPMFAASLDALVTP